MNKKIISAVVATSVMAFGRKNKGSVADDTREE